MRALPKRVSALRPRAGTHRINNTGPAFYASPL